MLRVVMVWTTLLLLASASPVLAFTPRAGDTVVVAEPLSDDLYAAGGMVEVTAPIDGDVAAAGGTLTVSGPVTGGVLATGGTISIRGRVGRSVRAVGGQLSLAAPVGQDAVLAGSTVTVEAGSEIGRDLAIAAGRITVSGAVGDDAYLTGGSIVIGGTIGGSVEAHADRIVLLPGARITGTLRYSADSDVEVQQGAQIGGQVTRVPRPARSRSILNPAARLGFRFAGRVLEALWLLAIGLVLAALAPRTVQGAADQLRRHLGWSLLTGFILLVVVPVAAVLLLITIVGIPMAAAVMLLYLATLYPAQVFVAAWLGGTLLRRGARTEARPPYLEMLLGVVLLVILVGLPYVGWALRLLALCIGFGAFWSALWSARTAAAPPAEQPAV